MSTSILDHTLDPDSHEMTPMHLWEDTFGKASGRIAEITEPMFRKIAESGHSDMYHPGLVADKLDVTVDNVWNMKGASAPSAFDFSRRGAVMDCMGIKKQLVFPSYGLFALALMGGHIQGVLGQMGVDVNPEECVSLGRAGLAEYNEWAARTTSIDPDRIRLVGYVPPTTTVAELLAETESLIDKGIRVIHIAHGEPPAGLSPAHPDLDVFWALLAELDVVCTTHILGQANFMRSDVWVKAPAFAPGKVYSHEIGLEPYSFATLHLPIANFLACMLLGGVFERHPRLRFGVIELGSSWLGPMADNFDMWARDMYAARLAPFISKLPSDYLREQVRVTPFNEVEPVKEYLTRYPHLQECYCYSTDYPHVEGGKDSKRRMYEKLEPMGNEVVSKFFVKNAEFLFPE